MRLGCAVRQEFLVELLPGKWLNRHWVWLGLGGRLTRNIGLQHRTLLNGEERRAVCPVKDEEEALFTDLRHGISHFAVVFHGEQHGVRGEVTTHTSWWTPWKCQMSFPVLAFSASRLLAYRLSPMRPTP